MAMKWNYAELSALIVEDEPYTRTITRRLLQQIGVKRIAEAGNAETAAEIVGKSRPDIVICDIHLGPTDGFTFFESLKSQIGRRIPVIMLTADTGPETRARSEAAGIRYHLTKPVSAQQIKDCIDAIVAADPDLAARMRASGRIDFGSKRILVVDDEEIVRRAERKMLAQFGATNVAEASDGQQALEAFQRFKPDLIICDVHMKPLGGLEFVAALRASSAERTPVIIVTGDKSVDTVAEARKNGVAGYLLKPMNALDLRIRVEHALSARD